MDSPTSLAGKEHGCNVCMVFAAKPLRELQSFHLEAVQLFQHTGVDFAGPLTFRKKDKSESKANIIIFTFAVAKAVVSDNAAVFKTTADWIRKIRKSD